MFPWISYNNGLIESEPYGYLVVSFGVGLKNISAANRRIEAQVERK